MDFAALVEVDKTIPPFQNSINGVLFKKYGFI